MRDGFRGERALTVPEPILRNMEKDPIAAQLHVTHIGYYPQARYHFRQRREPIDQCVFIYCIDGAGWFRLDGRQYAVGANQYFILPAGVPHAYGADEDNPWTIYWVHFRGRLAPCFLPSQPGPVDVVPQLHSRIHQRIDLFEEILHTLEMGYSRENLLYACAVLHYFLASLRYLQPYRNAPRREPGAKGEPVDIVTAAIHYMKENIGRRLTLEQMAGRLGYTPTYFASLFSQRTGYAPIAYFNQLLSDEAYAGAEFPAALVVGGALYASTGRPMPGEAAPSAILGTVRSYAEELPTEEGQSNFDWSCTAPYAETADGLAVLVDHEWTLFEPFGRGN